MGPPGTPGGPGAPGIPGGPSAPGSPTIKENLYQSLHIKIFKKKSIQNIFLRYFNQCWSK